MSSETDSQYHRVVIENVLNAETNDARFETFCNSLISIIEGGATVVGTSSSWDRGRDGVGLGRATGLYVLTSLRDDIDAKVLSDLERIRETTSGIQRLYFCLNARLSEHARDKYQDQLAAESNREFPIVCLGSGHLSELGAANPNIVERHYAAELADVLRVMAADPSDSAEIRGLRLALISTAVDSSDSIRREVYSVGLLDVLKDKKGRSLSIVCKDLAESLRLNRSIAPEAVRHHIDILVDKNLLSFSGAQYQITELGMDDVGAREQAGVGKLLELRQAVRDSLESAIGSKIVDDEFTRIWGVFEERMAHYFHSRGEAVVKEIRGLLGDTLQGEPAVLAEGSSLSFLEELANAVGATSSHSSRSAELVQAVKDLFSDRTGVATTWLVRIAANFMAACALGLEHSSSAALLKLLSRTRLVLDTDVVLTLLGEGEPEHDGVVALINRWKRLGGRILVAEPVLEEVARHAFIAQRDFDEVVHFLPGSADDRARLIGNAFVRSFAELMEKGEAKLYEWREYIRQFRGSSEYDWANVLNSLSGDYSIHKLPLRSLESAALEKQVREFFVRRAAAYAENGRNDPNAADKARRDAQLYAALVDHIRQLRLQDPGATCLLVSSAKRLASAEAEFAGTDEPHLVVSIAGMLYLLSLLPDVTLGLSAMKAFLFDERRSRFSSEFERKVLRMIRGSSEVSLSFAKRGLLMRSVRERVLKDASEQGERGHERSIIGRFEADAFSPAKEKGTLKLVSAALDEVGADRKLAKENADLRAKVRELEEKLMRPAKRR